jgi:hypothetical protein
MPRPSPPWQYAQTAKVFAPLSTLPSIVAGGGRSGSVLMCAITLSIASSVARIFAIGAICLP